MFRGLPDPVLYDPGVCWDTALLPGDVSGTVHLSGRAGSVEAHADDERSGFGGLGDDFLTYCVVVCRVCVSFCTQRA